MEEIPGHPTWCTCSQCAKLPGNPLTQSRAQASQRRAMEWSSVAGSSTLEEPAYVAEETVPDRTATNPPQVSDAKRYLEAIQKQCSELLIPSMVDNELVFEHPPTPDTQLNLNPAVVGEHASHNLTLSPTHPNNRPFLYATSTVQHLRAQILEVSPSDTLEEKKKAELQQILDNLNGRLDDIHLVQWITQGQRACNTSQASSNRVPIILTGRIASSASEKLR